MASSQIAESITWLRVGALAILRWPGCTRGRPKPPKRTAQDVKNKAERGGDDHLVEMVKALS
jgi:hypothetical protein